MEPATSYRLLRDFASSLGVIVTEGAWDQISRYFKLLGTWNARLRLTGIRDTQALVDKQAADAIAVASVLAETGSVVDIGTGAGLPGMLLACLRPGLSLTLVDSRERPVSFLREAVRALSLSNVRVELMRAEAAIGRIELQSAAVSCAVRMQTFLRLARPLLERGALAISLQTEHLAEDEAARQVAAESFLLRQLLPYTVPAGARRRLVIATAA